ncbi:MAG: cyclic nucleotide-binding domain-containing protein [Candidatus Latescibacteria bacterium]|nr:cyclic nucleotide-binding domain-containing protein [Candidatus Latescibacterota bacterium]
MDLKKIFTHKNNSEPAENLRSGEDRRQENIPVAETKRTNEDRRTLIESHSKIIETYGKIPMFKNLSNEQLLKILRICSKTKCTSMNYLFRKGEESKNMYILMKGRLNIMLRTNEAWKTITPFESVGEMGFFNNSPRCTDVTAETECILLQLNKNEVSKLFSGDRELHVIILQNVIQELTKKILSDHDEIEELHFRINAIDKI